MVEPHDVTVVVPTYRRAHDLMHCLGALQAQDAAGFEVVVVDNADDDALRAAVARLEPGAARSLRYVSEPLLGLHHARHAGARAAAGRLLLYIDDDAVCEPGWVSAYCQAFADDGLAAAGGPIRAQWLEEPPAWLRRAVERTDSFSPLALMEPDGSDLGDRAYFFGANMAIRRDVLFALGGFHPDSFGRTWLGDGESGLNRELWRRELAVRYVADAVVHHRVPHERMTLRYLRLRMRNEGAAGVYALLHPFAFRRRGLARVALAAARTGWRSWLESALRWRRTDPRSLQAHMRAALKVGELRMALLLLRSRDLWPLVTRERWLEPDEAEASAP